MGAKIMFWLLIKYAWAKAYKVYEDVLQAAAQEH